jgi:hypothetical protein
MHIHDTFFSGIGAAPNKRRPRLRADVLRNQ